MAMLSILPRELCIIIDEMNPEHREKFNFVKKDLELKLKKKFELESVMNRILRTRDEWISIPNYERPSYFRMVIEEFTDTEDTMNTLNNCNCCERHQTKKPKSINNSGGYDPSVPGAFAQLNYNCECECRHTSRILYKNLINQQYYNELYEDDDDEDWYDEYERYW
tara:strand:- start:391 stop:888 length:498 start_codon:yes stop_codon:yes gene_type:complete